MAKKYLDQNGLSRFWTKIKEKLFHNVEANDVDDYAEANFLDRNGNTITALPFRKINGESIIGKDPLTISGGGTSHPVYTEANTDKYTVAKVGGEFLVTFTGESGSRYYFNFDSMQYSSTDGCNNLAFKIINTDVKVFAYTKLHSIDTFYHEISDTDCVAFHNDKFLSVVITDYANSLKWSTHNAQSVSMGNSYYDGNTDYYVTVANDYNNNDVQYLMLTMYKNEVGVLEVVVESQGDI